MGQQLFKVHSEISDPINPVNADVILSISNTDDIRFFFPPTISSNGTTNFYESNQDEPIPSFELIFIKQIQNHLSQLTRSTQLNEVNDQINEILKQNIFPLVETCYKNAISQITDQLEKQQRLQKLLTNIITEEKYAELSFCAKPNVDLFGDDKKPQQLSYFAVQSLTSILLILIKSVEKNDSPIIQQILMLTNQLCEQIPMRSLSSTNNNNLLFKSLKPLINYIQQLSLSNDPIQAQQALLILLNFSIAKASFKDILSLMNKFIFDQVNVYNVRNLFIQLNNGLTETIKQQQNTLSDSHSDSDEQTKTTDEISLNYLKSIGVYPNTSLIKLDEKLFTGQFIFSVVLAHIDFDNQIHSNEQFKHGSIESSFSFEFHPNTFQTLFDIITQLVAIITPSSNDTIIQMLTVCIRLFTTHLKYLCAIKSNLHRDLLATNDEIRKSLQFSSAESNDDFDLSKFVTDDQLKNWFQLFLRLACQRSEQKTISQAAAKAIIYLLDKRTLSFTEKLSFIHQHIVENQHSILIQQLLIELNKKEILMSWIEILCNNNHDKITALQILYSLIDIYFDRSSGKDKELKLQIEKILLLFQQLLIHRLIPHDSIDGSLDRHSSISASPLVIDYLTYLFKNFTRTIEDDLFNAALVGLCLMTKINEIFDYATIQPIFSAMGPQIAEYLLQNTTSENTITNSQHLMSWLLGKMSYVMITGSPQDSLEMKHIERLKLVIFAGGYEKPTVENSVYLSDLLNSNLAVYSKFQLENKIEESLSDKDLLMSIYNNVGDGAQLMLKMKIFVEDKQNLLQKSIEEQATDLCAAVFAVYIKHFRRINLVKYELSHADERKPHSQLVSIYKYANHARNLLETIKEQGGDCDEFFKQVKTNALFLLSSVKESDLIPIINEDLSFQRQISRWTKAKHVMKLLRVCNRFKNLMLTKKQIFDYENLLNQTIDQFIYEDFYKINTSIINVGKVLELDELEKCLCRQYERAMIRLITYRFIQTFVQNICNLKDQNRARIILTIYLPHLRNSNLEWSYFENIPVTNNQLKVDIRNSYYSTIKSILSLLESTNFQSSKILIQNIFNLLNISYESDDISHLYRHRLVEILFTSFISFIQNSDFDVSLDLKLIVFIWFRLFLFKLCQNILMDKLKDRNNQLLCEQRELIFNTLILQELRGLKRAFASNTENTTADSLKDVSTGWFQQAIVKDTSDKFFSKLEIDLCINQYLILLLRCVNLYEHVRSTCATVDFIEQLIDIYHDTQHNVTRLLSLKILRQLLSYLPDNIDGTSKNLIEKFLIETLFSIGESFTSQYHAAHLVTELIYLCRTIMSLRSAWQIQAIHLVFDSIVSNLNLKSLESNDTIQINNLLGSLCVLGGYIHPFCLSSIVRVSTDDESRLAMIIEIDTTDELSPFSIQYLDDNQIESMTIDKLQVEIEVLPPNFFSILTENDSNAAIHSVLDALGSFVQLDTSTSESLMLLQLKRRSIAALFQILNDQKIVEIFLEKPYASIIAQLSISDSVLRHRRQPSDIRLLTKQHLEQYSLSLDICERLKQIIDNDKNETKTNSDELVHNQSIVNALSTPTTKYNGWKPYASKTEIQLLKRGRIGIDEISIVPFPGDAASMDVFKESGQNHKFKGQICLTRENTNVSFPSFILDSLQFSEGKWYFCVKLSFRDLIQIGWATNGFTPRGDSGTGIGDDQYSWCYDGSRAVFFNNGEFPGQFDDIRWKENDVCGCGIEIDGENTNIKYWLNGKLLGTAFKHQTNIPLSTVMCNLLPHGRMTTYFPGVSVQVRGYRTSCCEMIFSPEDMHQCPLPDGYKPLLLPKLVQIENSIVAYPFNAYLVGDHIQDYFYTSRIINSTVLLRDFVNEHHLSTEFTVDNHQLILLENSSGFLLSIDNDASLFTITFDFEILTSIKDEQFDIQLFKLDTTEVAPVKILLKKMNKSIRIVIVFNPKEQQAKVYLNSECQTFEIPFQSESNNKLNFYLLPKIAAGIRNVGVWKYSLPEDQIQRLFIYGLFFVAIDYYQLKEYRKRGNTFLFKQKEFPNELLVPFDQPFEDNIWKIKKKQIQNDESKYFSANDQSTIALLGKKTYLVLEKSINPWFEYTIIFDISIPNWLIDDEQLSLVTLNDKSHIFVTHDGKLCLQAEEINKESNSTLILNEYFRLWISVKEESIKIYVNGLLEIDVNIDDDRFSAQWNRFDLFREINLTKNTTDEDKLRIQCQSITLLNRSTTMNEQMKTPNTSLDTLVAPPFSIIAPSLIAIGYKKEWIQSVMKQSRKMTNIQTIDEILRVQKEQFLKEDIENQRKHYLKILSRLDSSIDQQKLEDLIDFSKCNTKEQIADVSRLMLSHCNKSIDNQSSMNKDESCKYVEDQWFRQSVSDLAIDKNISEWILDPSTTEPESDNTSKLIDLTQLEQEQTIFIQNQPKEVRKSFKYSHREISRKQYFESRISCEHALTTIYARHTVLNMLKVWSNTTLFPLDKFGDSIFIIKLLRVMHYHFTYTSSHLDEKIDRMNLLIDSLFRGEMKQLFEHVATQEEINWEILENKAPLVFQLQNYILLQSIRFLLNENFHEKTAVNEHTIIKQSSLSFILKILNLFAEIIKDKSTMKQNELDSIVPLLFPIPLINVMFDLFLLLPTHQSKVFILYLFSTLIQSSKNFNLTDRIQHFLIKLLIELSSNSSSISNRSTKNVEISTMDLVFLLSERQKKQRIKTAVTEDDAEQQQEDLESHLTQLPQNIRDLFAVIDAIHALTDQTIVPRSFFEKSQDLLGDGLELSRNEFDNCRSHFDITADLQLVSFMNNDPLLNNSFVDFIQNLSTESVSNSTFYRDYPLLPNIPANYVVIRAKFIYQLNKFVETVLPTVDLSLSPGQSILTDQIRAAKVYLLNTTKFQLFNESLEKTEMGYDFTDIEVQFDTIEGSSASENTMFYQAYRQLHEDAHRTFRRQNEQIWCAQYLNMQSTDRGGHYRDSITQIGSNICSTRLPLFILCPNGRSNSGSNQDCWIPNVFSPNKPIPEKFKKQYRFIGQLMGLAMRKKHYLDLKFPLLLWKQLLKESITIDDIQAIDLQSFTMIHEMEKKIEQAKSVSVGNNINNLFSSILNEMKFDVVSSTGETFEVIPGGNQILTTVESFKEYCASYRQYRLQEFDRQIALIRQGLCSIVPCYYLNLFTADELKEAICGKGYIDIELLKRNTNYTDGYSQNSPVIQRFWTVLSEMFNEEQKKLLLKFAWGRGTLPSGDNNFTSKFNINRFHLDASEVDKALPRSYTCFFIIDLPEYSTSEIMYERLNYAITHCTSIDGDGHMVEELNGMESNSDSACDE